MSASNMNCYNPSRRAIYQAHGNGCFYCGKHLDLGQNEQGRVPKNTRDHFFPSSLGRQSILGNFVMACHKCNVMKGNRIPDRDECIRFYKTWAASPHTLKILSQYWHDFATHQQVIEAFTNFFRLQPPVGIVHHDTK